MNKIVEGITFCIRKFNWFEEHPEINLIEWPAQTADVNIVENIWGEMVRQWPHRRLDAIRENLNRHVCEVFDDLLERPNYMEALYNSIHPKRLQAVVDAQGHMTKY